MTAPVLAGAVKAAHMRLATLLLFLSSTWLAADPRSDLDAAFAALLGHEPVRARIELRVETTSGDPKKPETHASEAHATAETTRTGVLLFWDEEQLQRAASEPENNEALDALTVSRLANYLHAVPQLVQTLKNAELTEAEESDWQGEPARRLSFLLKPELSEKDRKYIKELEARATLWLGTDGTPLAAEHTVKVRGRAMLVIGFESAETERYEYARRGDRLLVTRHDRELRGSGGGENSQQKATARLFPDPAD